MPVELTFRDENVWRKVVKELSKLGRVRGWKSCELTVRRHHLFAGGYEELLGILRKSKSSLARLFEKGVRALREIVEKGIVDEIEGKSVEEVEEILIDRLEELKDLRELRDRCKNSENLQEVVHFAFLKTFTLEPILVAMERLTGKDDKMRALMEKACVDVTPLLGLEIGEELEKSVKVFDVIILRPVYKLSLDWLVDEGVEDVLAKYAEHCEGDVDAVLSAELSVVDKILDILDGGKVEEEELVGKVVEELRKTVFVAGDYEFCVIVDPEAVRDALNSLDGILVRRKGKYVRLLSKRARS